MEPHDLIERCDFFKGEKLTVGSIYKDDPFEKCFLVEIASKGKKFKVRLSHPQFIDGVQTEAEAFRVLKNNGIDWLPTVYWEEYNDNSALIVYDYFDGMSLDKLSGTLTNSDTNKIVEQLYYQIKQLHQVKGEYFSEMCGPKFEKWIDFLSGKLFKHVDNALKIKIITNADYKIIEKKFYQHSSYFNNVESTFLHFDIKPANIIFDRKSGQAKLVDFELSRYGDIEMEYSRFISYHLKEDDIYRNILLPLGIQIFGKSVSDFTDTTQFNIYHLYNLLAYYTTSFMTRNISRDYLLNPIYETINKLEGS